MDKDKKQVFYSITSTGGPVPYDKDSSDAPKANFTSNDALMLEKKKNPTLTDSQDSIEPSNRSSTYSIVFPACQWVIDMRLPMGPKGDQGLKGPNGDIGQSGGPGDKGEYGFIGNWGKP